MTCRARTGYRCCGASPPQLSSGPLGRINKKENGNLSQQNKEWHFEHPPSILGCHLRLNSLDGCNNCCVRGSGSLHSSTTVLADAVDRCGRQSAREALRFGAPLARRGLILPPDDCTTLSLVCLFQAQCVLTPNILDRGFRSLSGDPPHHHNLFNWTLMFPFWAPRLLS